MPAACPLQTIAAQCLRARDGRGEWRPVRQCVAALVATGDDPAISEAAAHAVADLAAWLRSWPTTTQQE